MILERMEADGGLRRMKRSGRLNRRRFWEFDESSGDAGSVSF